MTDILTKRTTIEPGAGQIAASVQMAENAAQQLLQFGSPDASRPSGTTGYLGVDRTARGFPQAIASGFKKYRTFSGRASRSEYWYFTLFVVLARFVFAMLDSMIFRHHDRILENLLNYMTITPWIAVEVRRLHDVDRSGWWSLLNLTIIGIFFPLLVWKCTKGTEGANRFGPNPLGADDVRLVQVFA
jgi:uncharacterized membrane protein YhaH (DUF805 family)